MSETAIQYILYYYMAFWLLNVVAYAVVSIGLHRWRQFVKGMSAEGIVCVTFRITVLFATARLVIGIIGTVLYELSYLSAIVTILVLGMTSLLLNTSFIMTEGWFLNREAQVVWEMPAIKQATVRDAINTFDTLRRTTNAA